MNLNEKARQIRYGHLLSNKEMADLTAGCEFGKITTATVKKWFNLASPQTPRKCYLEAIEKALKNGYKHQSVAINHVNKVRLKFSMTEFQLSKKDVSKLLGKDRWVIDRWLKKGDPSQPSTEQLKTLRQEALCLAKERKK